MLAAPIAGDDSAATDEDTPVTFGVLGNDSDPDGDPIMVVGVTDGALGTAVVNADNSITYTPSADFIRLNQTLTDTITYTIDDGPGMGGMATAQVTITVTGVNDKPFVQFTAYTTLGEYSVDGIDDLTFDAGSSYDLENESLTFTWLINGITLNPQPDGPILVITAADLFDLREFVGNSNAITVVVSDGIASVPDGMMLAFDTGSGNSNFASNFPPPTDWAGWAPAGNDLDVSGYSVGASVQNKLSKFGGEWALTTIPTLEPGGVNAPSLPAEKKIGYDSARSYEVTEGNVVVVTKTFPLVTPAQLARLNIRANLQRLKQDIVDSINELLVTTPPRVFNVAINDYVVVQLTDAQRSLYANNVADAYIRAVDNFLATHPGAKPMLGSRNAIQNWAGAIIERINQANDANHPWCATWAEGMSQAMNLIPPAQYGSALIFKPVQWNNSVLPIAGDQIQHNWIAIHAAGYPDIENKIGAQLNGESVIYFDPWWDILPRVRKPGDHSWLLTNWTPIP